MEKQAAESIAGRSAKEQVETLKQRIHEIYFPPVDESAEAVGAGAGAGTASATPEPPTGEAGGGGEEGGEVEPGDDPVAILKSELKGLEEQLHAAEVRVWVGGCPVTRVCHAGRSAQCLRYVDTQQASCWSNCTDFANPHTVVAGWLGVCVQTQREKDALALEVAQKVLVVIADTLLGMSGDVVPVLRHTRVVPQVGGWVVSWLTRARLCWLHTRWQPESYPQGRIQVLNTRTIFRVRLNPPPCTGHVSCAQSGATCPGQRARQLQELEACLLLLQ